MMTKLAASLVLCVFYAGCTAKSWQHTAPWNAPEAWEFNSKMEGWQSLVAGYRQLTAPKGFIWDDLTQSYQQKLSYERTSN
jgi:hypothetical protein